MAVMDISCLSSSLNRFVKFRVILPVENLADSDVGKKRFPTLYLLHGFLGSQDDWLYRTHILDLAETCGLAVVMPAGENSFYVDLPELGLNYGSFVGNELVSLTRRMFPLSDKRDDTFIGGLSMGGFGSLLLGSRFPETFGRIICLSGAFDPADPALKQVLTDPAAGLPTQYFDALLGNMEQPKPERNAIASALNALQEGKLPELYLACGTEDFLYSCCCKTRDLLSTAGAKIKWEQGPGIHDWYFWDTYIHKAVRWCLALP